MNGSYLCEERHTLLINNEPGEIQWEQIWPLLLFMNFVLDIHWIQIKTKEDNPHMRDWDQYPFHPGCQVSSLSDVQAFPLQKEGLRAQLL